ncbi:MAG: hypothetical protein K2W78_12450 [Xanthobacteraceae bacterium]|nr:hypothetical protein [Xanthobacteraceae bacterium]
MLRIRILASAIPLLAVSILAGGHVVPTSQPCISLGHGSVQMASAPWQNPDHVSFTDDPRQATVRVQLVERPELADFAVVDDVDASDQDVQDAASCRTTKTTRYVAVSAHEHPSEPIIFLSDEPGDYRLYIHSKRFSAREAAALLIDAAPKRGKLVLSQL